MPLFDDISAALSDLEHLANGRGDEELQRIHARLDNFRHALFGGKAPVAAPPEHDPNQPEVLPGDVGGVDRGNSADSTTPLDTTGLTPPDTEREVASENDVRTEPVTPAEQEQIANAEAQQGAKTPSFPSTETTPQNQNQGQGNQ